MCVYIYKVKGTAEWLPPTLLPPGHLLLPVRSLSFLIIGKHGGMDTFLHGRLHAVHSYCSFHLLKPYLL